LVIVLRASSTVRQGLQQLVHVPEDMDVVVVREHDGEVLYYVFGVKTLRSRLSTANPDADLASATYLGEFPAAKAGQLDPAAPVGSVALQGRQVIGVIVDDGSGGGARGGGGAAVRGLDPSIGADSDADFGPPLTGGGGPDRSFLHRLCAWALRGVPGQCDMQLCGR
jgi:hypothetical protein